MTVHSYRWAEWNSLAYESKNKQTRKIPKIIQAHLNWKFNITSYK